MKTGNEKKTTNANRLNRRASAFIVARIGSDMSSPDSTHRPTRTPLYPPGPDPGPDVNCFHLSG